MSGTDFACVSALLAGSEWTVRDEKIMTLDAQVILDVTDRGWVAIEFPDPVSQQTVRLVIDKAWSFGTVADLAGHVRMITQLAATIRGGE